MHAGARRAVAPAVLILVATAGCSSGSSPGAAPSPTTRGSDAPSTTTTTVAPLTGEPLVVTEQGVSSFPDPFDPTATLGGYGVVLQNPNAKVMATGVRVVTRVLDADGTELLEDSALVNAILPGQRMAVGRTLIEPIDDPTQLEVVVEVSEWLLPASTDGRLEAVDVVTEAVPDGGSVTTFAVRSTWPEEEEGVDATALYRGADGQILGAESTTIARVPTDEPVTVQIPLLSPIPDLATTEVFVGRGFAALTVG